MTVIINYAHSRHLQEAKNDTDGNLICRHQAWLFIPFAFYDTSRAARENLSGAVVCCKFLINKHCCESPDVVPSDLHVLFADLKGFLHRRLVIQLVLAGIYRYLAGF